ncbi:efflux RND transporter periplasmic adaptor subunit [Dyella solisilvae]|uniref:Efflux RND transporter periplasmic adaptor subunit n=1 Tax=Dyella solisilvae TaxID=1920168 RepID=A0A370K6R7_9GAMM|nr:efflux RND transporter periplasmic adaptor subunit [Dyella solisilvae]RDI98147.1 efflux RND transporter periplasmic adaptor subunit [Dyella solisilvae]
MSHDAHPTTPVRPPNLGRVVRLGLAVAVFAVIAGISVRAYDYHSAVKWTDAQMVPSVQVVTPENGADQQAMTLPGHLDAWISAPIHARVSGYLKSWSRDIGSQVNAGESLAEIDTPELDQQFEQAKADLARARATAKLATLTDKRWKNLLASNSVSKQEADEKAGEAEAAQANVLSAQANVDRIAALEAFKHVTAPFAGTVTARNTDIGDLISANSESGQPLFTVSDTSRMRLYVQVPQGYADAIRAGMSVKLDVPDHPGEQFAGHLIGNSGAVNQASGALLAQFEVDNPKGELLPGAYAEVHLPMAANSHTMTVPSTVLIFRAQGPQVAVLGADGRVELRNVHIARDLGDHLQVDQGIQPGDRIINHPPDSLARGDRVQVATSTEAPAGQAKKE